MPLSCFQTHGAPHAKKDKPVSREDFVAMVSERLLAVQKDRDHMRKRAQEQARQQGRTYDEIMVSTALAPGSECTRLCDIHISLWQHLLKLGSHRKCSFIN